MTGQSINERLGVAGSGAIACGLAAVAARGGPVVLWARSDASAEKARAKIAKLIERCGWEVTAEVEVTTDLARWMRPLALLVFAACMFTIVLTLFGGTISPFVSLLIYGLSAALIVVDFNYLRKHGSERDTVWLATGIFVSVVNIFVSLLNIFSGR